MQHHQGSARLSVLCSVTALLLAACGGGGYADNGNTYGGGQTAARLSESRSSTLALTSDGNTVWSLNPDVDTVSVLDVSGDKNQKVAEILVGGEPRCVAITPDNKKVYVTAALSNRVDVLDAVSRKLIKSISVGAEPTGCALALDGGKLYVANFSSDSVSVIDTYYDTVAKTITGVGAMPRAIAVAEVGGKSKVYVTQFLAQLVDDARTIDQKEGRDDGREGRVTVIDGSNDTVTKTIKLAAKITGFKSDGSTLDKLVFDPLVASTKVDTLAFPNQLETIVVRGNRAYLPNTASSPNGPVKFNVNVQAFVSVIDLDNDVEVVGETFNMNKGIQFEAVGKKLFPTNPSGLAFKHGADFEGFVLSRASDRLVRLVLDSANKPTINAPTSATDLGNVVRIEVGVDSGDQRNSSPEGVVINATNTRAYVMNLVSRDVSVIDVSGTDPTRYREIARVSSTALPTDAFAIQVLRGKELFNTSIGPVGTLGESVAPGGRMSDAGWGSCYGCHPRGLTDGVTWMFGDGPRQTISMESTAATQTLVPGVNLNANFAPVLPLFHQRALNWSAVRDEIQDFELNIRNVSGGQGLIALKDTAGKRAGVDPCVFNLTFVESVNCAAARATEAAVTTGRDADLDAIAAYISVGIRAPVSPAKASDADVIAGRALFAAANCQGCHGGANWTSSTLDFGPPPLGTEVTTAQLNRFLCKVGTFDAALANELKAGNAAATGQANTNGSNGVLGINIPSLLSVFASGPYLHSGAATTLDDVLLNVSHRSLGTLGTDTLASAANRAKLAKFVSSIDASTAVFPELAMSAAKGLCLP